MNVYNTDTQMLTCTCKDWEEVRSGYAMDNPRRLCKHIINKLDSLDTFIKLNFFI